MKEKNWLRLVVAPVMLAACLLAGPAAHAQTGNSTQDGRELGCIMHEAGRAKFVTGPILGKESYVESARKSVANRGRDRGPELVHSCLWGKLRNVPAAAYAALAEKYPRNFEPIAAVGAKSVAGRAASAAPKAAASLYRFIAPDAFLPPDILFFDVSAVINDGRVFGTAWELNGDFLLPHVAVLQRGKMTLLQDGMANVANQRGTIGGVIFPDTETLAEQAALFRGDKVVPIPRLDGEVSSKVLALTDRDGALVESCDDQGRCQDVLYKDGKFTPITYDLGPDARQIRNRTMNGQGIIAGTVLYCFDIQCDSNKRRGFRLDPRTGAIAVLNPLPTEPDSEAWDINSSGEVLGYSFVGGALERIGVWDKNNKFHVYFVEGTESIPTVSNRLLFNDNKLIVITAVSQPPDEEDRTSYLVTKPGVRANLADLVKDLPAGEPALGHILGLNDEGDLVGFASFSNAVSFFLQRIAK